MQAIQNLFFHSWGRTENIGFGKRLKWQQDLIIQLQIAVKWGKLCNQMFNIFNFYAIRAIQNHDMTREWITFRNMKFVHIFGTKVSQEKILNS
jgi:hypothetical protein